MKTIITIENSKITVQVDDQQPLKVDLTPEPVDIEPDIDQSPTLHRSDAGQTRTTLAPASAAGVRAYLPKTMNCEVCGTAFKPPTYKSRFCSRKCATKFYNKQNKAKEKVQEWKHSVIPASIDAPIGSPEAAAAIERVRGEVPTGY